MEKNKKRKLSFLSGSWQMSAGAIKRLCHYPIHQIGGTKVNDQLQYEQI
jgi:hypothetical protein